MKETSTHQTGNKRPPIVSVLGHVDHGKTSLLDFIRKTSYAKREAGGITQSIGASIVETKDGRKITFIDTPGHATFSKMRSRGAKVADLAILVVAADDGVKPQTREALEHIRKANTPFIVAANKIDLPTANIDRVKSELEKETVYFEGRGGDTILVPVSAKTGLGVEELLEMISLVAELREVTGDPGSALEAVVIETGKDNNRGILASVVVRNGTLVVGREVYADGVLTKIRGIFDFYGKPVKKLFPGEPGQILGFETMPAVGSILRETEISEKNEEIKKISDKERTGSPLIIKTKTLGGLEAILSNLPAGIDTKFSGVGDINENDIFLAKSQNAPIFVYEAKVSNSIARLAEKEGVLVERFQIIYELLEKIPELFKKDKKEVLGQAKIVAVFPYEKKKVAGCKVIEGRISKSDTFYLTREEKELGTVRITSLKKQKQDVNMVEKGEECGILFEPQLDFNVGDVLVSLRK